MRRLASAAILNSSLAFLALGCSSNEPTSVLRSPSQRSDAKPSSGSFATVIALPTLGGNSETRGINRAGTVIVGYASEGRGFQHPVKWTVQANGSWALTVLPVAPT